MGKIITLLVIFILFIVIMMISLIPLIGVVDISSILMIFLPIIIGFLIIATVYLMVYLPNRYKKLDINKVLKNYNPPEEFNLIYDKLYKEHITKLEKLRMKVKGTTILYNVLFFVLIVGYLLQDISPIYALIAIVSAFSIMIVYSKNKKNKQKYAELYKNEIVKNYIKLINEKLSYIPGIQEGESLQEEFRKSQIETRKFNTFEYDDYIEGELSENVYVKMSDINVSNITRDSRGRKQVEEIFSGIFAVTNCKNNINGHIKVSRERLFKNKKQRTTMDSEEFEKNFDIYSENKILAMQILTSDVMEKLIDFKNKYDFDFEIVFENNYIYLRFFTGKMFEPKIFGNSMDKKLLYVYYCILDFILVIVNEINKVVIEAEV